MGFFDAIGRDLIRYRAHRTNNYKLINIGALIMYSIVIAVLALSVFHYSQQKWTVLTYGDYDPDYENTAVTSTFSNTYFDGNNSIGLYHLIYDNLYLKNVSDCIQKTNMDYFCPNHETYAIYDVFPDKPALFTWSAGYDIKDPSLIQDFVQLTIAWQQNLTMPVFCNLTDVLEKQCADWGGGVQLNAAGIVPCANVDLTTNPIRSARLSQWIIYCVDNAFYYSPTAEEIGCLDYAENLGRAGLAESAPEICTMWAYDNSTSGLKYETHFIQNKEATLDTLSITSLSVAAGYTAITILSLLLFGLNTTFPKYKENTTAAYPKRQVKVLGIDLADSNVITPVQCISYIPHGKQHRRFVFIGVGIVVAGLLAGYVACIYLFQAKTTEEVSLGVYDPSAISNVATEKTDSTLVIDGTAFNFTYRMIWSQTYMPDPAHCRHEVFTETRRRTEIQIASNWSFFAISSDISTGSIRKTILYYNDPTLNNDICADTITKVCNNSEYVLKCFDAGPTGTIPYQCTLRNNAVVATIPRSDEIDDELTKCGLLFESQYPTAEFCDRWTHEHSADFGTIFVRTYEKHLSNLEVLSYAMQPVITVASVSIFILGCMNYQRHIVRDIRKSRKTLRSMTAMSSGSISTAPTQANLQTLQTLQTDCCQLDGESFYTPTRAIVYEASPENNYLFLNVSRILLFVVVAIIFGFSANYFANIPTTTTSLGSYDAAAQSNVALSALTTAPKPVEGYTLSLRSAHIQDLDDCNLWTSYEYLCNRENVVNLYAFESRIVFEITNALETVQVRYIPTRAELTPSCLLYNDTVWESGPTSFCVLPLWAPPSPAYIVEKRTCLGANNKNNVSAPRYYCQYSSIYYEVDGSQISSDPSSFWNESKVAQVHQLGQACSVEIEQIFRANYSTKPGCDAAIYAPANQGNFYTRTYISYPSGVTVLLLCLSIMNPLLVVGHILIDMLHTRFFTFKIPPKSSVQLGKLNSQVSVQGFSPSRSDQYPNSVTSPGNGTVVVGNGSLRQIPKTTDSPAGSLRSIPKTTDSPAGSLRTIPRVSESSPDVPYLKPKTDQSPVNFDPFPGQFFTIRNPTNENSHPGRSPTPSISSSVQEPQIHVKVGKSQQGQGQRTAPDEESPPRRPDFPRSESLPRRSESRPVSRADSRGELSPPSRAYPKQGTQKDEESPPLRSYPKKDGKTEKDEESPSPRAYPSPTAESQLLGRESDIDVSSSPRPSPQSTPGQSSARLTHGTSSTRLTQSNVADGSELPEDEAEIENCTIC